MAKYKMFQVTVPVDEDSVDYRHIREYAEREGISLDDAVRTLVILGVRDHIKRNLTLVERYAKKS